MNISAGRGPFDIDDALVVVGTASAFAGLWLADLRVAVVALGLWLIFLAPDCATVRRTLSGIRRKYFLHLAFTATRCT